MNSQVRVTLRGEADLQGCDRNALELAASLVLSEHHEGIGIIVHDVPQTLTND